MLESQRSSVMLRPPGGMPELRFQRDAEKEQKMSPKVKAMFAEFPFLRDTYHENYYFPVSEFRVSRIDENKLGKRAVKRYSYWCGLSQFHFYREDGTRVGGRHLHVGRIFNREPLTYTFGQVLEQAPAYTYYVAWYQRVTSTDNVLTLFKPPKGHMIHSWLTELTQNASAEIKAELAQVEGG